MSPSRVNEEESLRFLPVLTFFPFDSNPGLSQLCGVGGDTALHPLAEGEARVGSQVLELEGRRCPRSSPLCVGEGVADNFVD